MPYPFKSLLEAAKAAVKNRHYSRAALLYYQAVLAGSEEARHVLDGKAPTPSVGNDAVVLEVAEENLQELLPTVLQLMMGLGVARDDHHAFTILRRWADKNSGVASLSEEEGRVHSYLYDLLAWMYLSGRGVVKNDAQAVRWYQRAADLGDAGAMNNLGWMYGRGRGVGQDDVQAVQWYQRAVNLGHTAAMSNLA